VQALRVLVDSIYSICFNHHSESDPDEVFDKNVIFLKKNAFCSKCFWFCFLLAHIHVLIKNELN